MSFQNLNQAIFENLTKLGGKPAVMTKINGSYRSFSYAEVKDKVMHLAAALLEEGLQFRDPVVIISNTRAEWIYADMGGLFSGAIISAVYPTTVASETAYIINDIQAKYLFIENREQLNKILSIRPEIPSIKKVFVFDDFEYFEKDGWVVHFDELLNRGAQVIPSRVEEVLEIISSIQPEDTLTIIYTSGTTGLPKGVVLSHANYLATIENMLKHSQDEFLKVKRNLSFLPLAHALERAGGYYIMLYTGKTIGYAEGFDTIIDNLKEVKPSFIAGVPRVYEKIYSRIQEGLKTASNSKKRLFNWALEIGKRSTPYRKEAKPMPFFLNLKYKLADKLIYKKINERFGGEIKFFLSGGAPLSADIARFFYALNLPIIEGWGATEGTAPYTVNTLKDFEFGTVGKTIPGIELKVADDGEFLVRGPNIFKEYYQNEDATRESFTEEGFFKTGDIGEISPEGWVKITDRKKQLIITAGGKNVAPAAIQKLLVGAGLIESAYIHGDKKKYVTALLCLDPDTLERLANENDIAHLTKEELITHPIILDNVQQKVDKANEALTNYMQVKYFKILADNFSIDNGLLTPTMKLKNKVIGEKYRTLIDSMYELEEVI